VEKALEVFEGYMQAEAAAKASDHDRKDDRRSVRAYGGAARP